MQWKFISVLLVTMVWLNAETKDSHPHSNIDLILSLQNHNYGPNDKNYNSSYADEEYDFCINGILETTSKDKIFGPYYRFGIEFTPISLPCSPCRYSTRPGVKWRKLTFENVEIEIRNDEAFHIGQDDSLIIKNPQADNFGTYYCIIQGFVGYIWSIEIEPFQYFDISKARHWHNNQTTNSTSMKISIVWEQWSLCNKCDVVGKRHKIGYCHVEAFVNNEPNQYKALQIYKNGLSCNLFLLIHPDLDPDTIESLERKPVLMISYCRTPCDYFQISPEDAFNIKIHPKIKRVYYNEMESRADLELEKLREKNKAKRDLIPGMPTFFEGLTLVLLLSLQAIIIIHVCRNFRKAK